LQSISPATIKSPLTSQSPSIVASWATEISCEKATVASVIVNN